jgi:hypothetical protein
MKIVVVIGGSGLIGSKTVTILRQGGHEVIAGSPKIGVNSITGAGLKEAMADAKVVIDLTNSPSFEDRAVLEFFETSGRNLLTVEAPAGVRHHVALSIVGIERTDNGYFRAKVTQEKLIVASGIPFTIIRATQFLEFLGGIADSSVVGNVARLPPVLSSPSRRTTLLLWSRRSRSLRRETASLKSPAQNERRSTKSLPAISRSSATHVRSCATRKLNIGVAGSLSTRLCRGARRVLAASVWTSGFGAHLLGAESCTRQSKDRDP